MSRAMQDIRTARALLAECRNLHDALASALDRAQHDLQSHLSKGVRNPVQGLPEDLPPASDHRRTHRPGRPARIDTDPELRAFIRARIERMTFVALAAEIAETFPPERRVGKSAIHKWWQRTHPR